MEIVLATAKYSTFNWVCLLLLKKNKFEIELELLTEVLEWTHN